MHDFLVRRVWGGQDLLGRLLWILLLPPSFFYSLAVHLRNLLYSAGWMPVKALPCAVVSVGNLTVGGTGKTPATLWLAQELGSRGYRVAILSRGYKRTGKEPAVLLEPESTTRVSPGQTEDLLEAGDEPAMMARLFGQRVGVGKIRYEVATRMLHEAELDLFLLDDGFQHRQLRRDLDLLLLGSDWRGRLLPAGPFREPKSSLSRADLFLLTGAKERWEPLLARHSKENIFSGYLESKGLLGLEQDMWKEYPLGLLDRRKILTVSAIANPYSFYEMIRDWGGEIVDTMEFPDHHLYSPGDWQRINRAARNVDLIVTTEKDLLKLVRFPFAKEKLLALRVEMVVENGDSLVRTIEEAIQAKRKGAVHD